MKDVGRYLLETETPVVVVRRHWAFLARNGAIFVACQLAALFIFAYLGSISLFDWAAMLLLVGSLAWFGLEYGQWWVERFVVTDKRVLLTSGLIAKRVAIMPLTKVTDLTYQRPLLGRLLGYGVFVVESAGQDQALSRIDFLPNPDRVYRDVSALLFGPKEPQIAWSSAARVRQGPPPALLTPYDDRTVRIAPDPDDLHTRPIPRL